MQYFAHVRVIPSIRPVYLLLGVGMDLEHSPALQWTWKKPPLGQAQFGDKQLAEVTQHDDWPPLAHDCLLSSWRAPSLVCPHRVALQGSAARCLCPSVPDSATPLSFSQFSHYWMWSRSAPPTKPQQCQHCQMRPHCRHCRRSPRPSQRGSCRRQQLLLLLQRPWQWHWQQPPLLMARGRGSASPSPSPSPSPWSAFSSCCCGFHHRRHVYPGTP
mmetsp:Transcript_137893/g.243657  ORF Transcript_137893/g.243657 Transcript_137893/m.243657 type:complete len:215 (-) Transcript_137893:1640-2284(-)